MADSIFEPEISRSLRHLCDTITVPYSLAIECKKVSGTSFSLSRINNDQLEALLYFQDKSYYQKMLVSASVGGKSRFKLKSGFDFLCCPTGIGYILVNFRATKKAAGKEIPKGTNRCFAITVDQFVNAMSEMVFCEDRQSIPYNWFEKNALELSRVRWEVEKGYEYGWDLTSLFNYTTKR